MAFLMLLHNLIIASVEINNLNPSILLTLNCKMLVENKLAGIFSSGIPQE